MTLETFNKILEEQIERSSNMLIKKGAEYATEDRLHNFRQAAQLQNCSLRQALGGFMAKHTISIYDMIESDKDYSEELWNEKITDHINYLLLLAAVVRDNSAEDILQDTFYKCDSPKIVSGSEWTFDPFDTWTDVRGGVDNVTNMCTIHGTVGMTRYMLQATFIFDAWLYHLSVNGKDVVMSEFEIVECTKFVNTVKERGYLDA